MSQTDFSTTVLTADTTAAVLVTGELDLATAPELHDALASCLEQGYDVIDVDMRDVTFLACAGINVLLDAWRTAASAGVLLQVVRPSSVGDRLLTLTATRPLLGPGDQLAPEMSVG